ncbi:MAG: zinc ribbon domain-containing protein [Elainella sp.]
MAYRCDLGGGQSLLLDNQGTQTRITLASSSAGQQQQSTQGLETGVWTGTPQVLATAGGWILKLQTVSGELYWQIQGQSLHRVDAAAVGMASPLPIQPVESPTAQPMTPMQPIQPMQPMTPMQPMRMGNMSMSLNPMEMRMGDMTLRMGGPQASSASTSAAAPTTKRFCSQCGAGIQPADRFCSSCGVQLNPA